MLLFFLLTTIFVILYSIAGYIKYLDVVLIVLWPYISPSCVSALPNQPNEPRY